MEYKCPGLLGPHRVASGAAPEQKGEIDTSMRSAKALQVERPLNRQEGRTGSS
jgi:hypothetical protein